MKSLDKPSVKTSAKSADKICPVLKTATLLSDTWTILIIHELLGGPRRFCELEDALGRISSRTLTLKLKKLVEDGLLEKTDTGSYCATKKGKGIQIIEEAMRKYGEKFLKD